MVFRKRITLVMVLTVLGIMWNVDGYCAKQKVAHIVDKPKKISVKHSRRDKDHQSTVDELQAKINIVKQEVRKNFMTVEASAYTLSKRETDSNPFQTATNQRPIPGKTCAVSRDLKHLLNRNIYLIKEQKTLYVNDIMHKRYKKSIDMAVSSRKVAFDFGRKDVKIIVLN